MRLTFRAQKAIKKLEKLLCRMLIFYVVIRCNKKLEKLPKLEIPERSVLGVWIGKSGPLERTRIANQIQVFRIPDR